MKSYFSRRNDLMRAATMQLGGRGVQAQRHFVLPGFGYRICNHKKEVLVFSQQKAVRLAGGSCGSWPTWPPNHTHSPPR